MQAKLNLRQVHWRAVMRFGRVATTLCLLDILWQNHLN
jgi:hypothetical protein